MQGSLTLHPDAENVSTSISCPLRRHSQSRINFGNGGSQIVCESVPYFRFLLLSSLWFRLAHTLVRILLASVVGISYKCRDSELTHDGSSSYSAIDIGLVQQARVQWLTAGHTQTLVLLRHTLLNMSFLYHGVLTVRYGGRTSLFTFESVPITTPLDESGVLIEAQWSISCVGSVCRRN
ncbi:uncharacterized protein ARMOST_01000 [Armillaria ostoyae]|uniref:Uncharacterized protein n=1 Tax=Armillaria ostoyae TaxID=47428 RepID=A0A284QMR3_ARMOS|nr:uncharacterized protein ARMOST_01000 [Armillaria ostoyae]